MKQIAVVFAFLFLTFSQNVLAEKLTECQTLMEACSNARKAQNYKDCSDKCSQAIVACAPARDAGSMESATAARRHCKNMGNIKSSSERTDKRK